MGSLPRDRYTSLCQPKMSASKPVSGRRSSLRKKAVSNCNVLVAAPRRWKQRHKSSNEARGRRRHNLSTAEEASVCHSWSLAPSCWSSAQRASPSCSRTMPSMTEVWKQSICLITALLLLAIKKVGRMTSSSKTSSKCAHFVSVSESPPTFESSTSKRSKAKCNAKINSVVVQPNSIFKRKKSTSNLRNTSGVPNLRAMPI
mmetsp:Transcript_107515/g.342832  ORF Transcript_107515/g.342832 Transcript_107515/m.342832 type:complete len:201 (-) Transcript_107515:6285-6887(-)